MLTFVNFFSDIHAAFSQEPSKKAIVQVLESRGANVVFVPDISYTVEGLTVSLQGSLQRSSYLPASTQGIVTILAHKVLEYLMPHAQDSTVS